MRKANFIVSADHRLWFEGCDELFIVEPYVHHTLERSGSLGEFRSIEVAPYPQSTRADLERASTFVDGKYREYVPLLAERLNRLHGTSHDATFWRKALSMAFLRYLTVFHDLFHRCELHFDPDRHVCNTLSRESFRVPSDFEEHRHLFQNSDFGQEQAFALYIDLFHPGRYPARECPFDDFAPTESPPEAIPLRARLRNALRRPAHAIGQLGWRRIVERLMTDPARPRALDARVRVGVTGVSISADHLARLFTRSLGRISPLERHLPARPGDAPLAWDERAQLSEFLPSFDRFDRYFFSTLKFCLPRLFVEHFRQVDSTCRTLADRYPKLSHVVCEHWISDTYLSIFLAILRERGVRHVYNEHNCFFHPYAGSYISHAASLSDVFVSLGWQDPEIPNLVRGASLYPFTVEGDTSTKYDILLIAGPAIVKLPHYCAAWGVDGYGALKHVRFTGDFLGALSGETLGRIAYRGYPPQKGSSRLLAFDEEYLLAERLRGIGGFAGFDEPSTRQMLQARIVVVNYIATAYLEALCMNLPTVFFWNPEAYYLNDRHRDFFKPLVDVGICQTDPIEAARHIESIRENPGQWWRSAQTQRGRNAFLEENLGKPQRMLEYLLALARGSDAGTTGAA